MYDARFLAHSVFQTKTIIERVNFGTSVNMYSNNEESDSEVEYVGTFPTNSKNNDNNGVSSTSQTNSVFK